jgi:hypothetical protein
MSVVYKAPLAAVQGEGVQYRFGDLRGIGALGMRQSHRLDDVLPHQPAQRRARDFGQDRPCGGSALGPGDPLRLLRKRPRAGSHHGWSARPARYVISIDRTPIPAVRIIGRAG